MGKWVKLVDINGKCRTRFAPSPTGVLHIGGARTALFNWLWAKHNGGKFFLRFEDTDQERSSDEYKTEIQKDLSWLGLHWDEPIVSQSDRLARYDEIREQLVLSGSIYPCFCPQSDAVKAASHERCACFTLDQQHRHEQIEAGKAHCWRFIVDAEETTVFHDSLRGEISISNDNFGDFVIFRSDGWPTYLLTVVVDDHDMEISHVIRGEEHLSNVPKQQLIYKAMGWTTPEWVHIPMVLDLNHQKLSKRTGALGIGEYRRIGWAPEALIAYMATLSWSQAPGDRIASAGELAEMFDLKGVALASPLHDPARLHHFGVLALGKTDREPFRNYVAVTLKAQPEVIDLLLDELLPGCANEGEFKDRIDFLSAAPIDPLFENGVPEWFGSIIETLRQFSPEEWTIENLKLKIRTLPKEYGIKAPLFYHPMRIALTGKAEGLPIPLLCALLGQKETINRLEKSIEDVAN